MKSPDQINAVVSRLIKQFGVEVAALGEFEAEMVCLENVAAGLIGSAAVRYNKQPDQLSEAFVEGVRERVTHLIYGRKQ